MPTRKRKPKLRVLSRAVVTCVIALMLAVPVGFGVAYADTLLGIRIVDRAQTPGGGEGVTALGICVNVPVYTITWNPMGGVWSDNSTGEKSTSVAYSSTPSAPDTLERAGYTFKGWSTNADATAGATSLPPATGVATWYAAWETKTYTITYNLAEGTVAESNPVEYTVETESFTLSNPQREGYTFTGWTGSNGTTPETTVTVEKGSTGNRSYTANWKINSYTITWKTNGGMWSDNSTADKTTSVDHNAATSAPDIPARAGYTFKGWSTTANGAVENIPSKTTSAATWYAVWEANTYAITLNPGAGSGGTAKVNAKYGSSAPDIDIPSRTGYSFDGYFDNVDGGTQYYTPTGTSAHTWDKAENTTLHAHWTAKKYAVSFNANGGTGGQTDAVEATYDAAMPAISATPPSRPGYTFAGWYDAQEDGNQYYSAYGISVANWNKDAATTLYAHWTLQINCTAPATALVTVDATGNVTGENQTFTSSTAEGITVTAVKGTSLAGASSVFADESTINGARILLAPPAAAGSQVEMPLTTTEKSVAANWSIKANSTLEVAFNLRLPDNYRLHYLEGDGQVSIASLSYEVSVATSS